MCTIVVAGTNTLAPAQTRKRNRLGGRIDRETGVNVAKFIGVSGDVQIVGDGDPRVWWHTEVGTRSFPFACAANRGQIYESQRRIYHADECWSYLLCNQGLVDNLPFRNRLNHRRSLDLFELEKQSSTVRGLLHDTITSSSSVPLSQSPMHFCKG